MGSQNSELYWRMKKKIVSSLLNLFAELPMRIAPSSIKNRIIWGSGSLQMIAYYDDGIDDINLLIFIGLIQPKRKSVWCAVVVKYRPRDGSTLWHLPGGDIRPSYIGVMLIRF